MLYYLEGGDKINNCKCSAQMQFSSLTIFLCLHLVKSAAAELADAKGHPYRSLALHGLVESQ